VPERASPCCAPTKARLERYATSIQGSSNSFTASVSRGEKIGLMGRNGAGKTTLLKSLVRSATGFVEDSDRHFDVDTGIVAWGHEVAVGYFAQDHSDSNRARDHRNRLAA
jgi:ATPase subunit of ABC transporter with duplicated ATPase domains